ncbi:hypothetical protein DFP72DRAFT_899780 [Ephemerocybe angulata]|uniref:F-box domain-containing protein n=1 Tax=Ephemerocybe angulata TaxID=980116 RepID=A0A8H6HW08_9AGAR|nr:hypothetical protein DFP72DRAFT_899780 [Tulosesus angulatus]
MAAPRVAVLSNYELLTSIFCCLLPWDPASMGREEVRTGRMQLRDAALACKAFRGPALACLWTYLDSLIPLVKVLPNVQLVGNTYSFHGHIPDDCALRKYARHIRVIDLRATLLAPQGTAPTVSPHVYVLMAKELEGKPLFPALRKVYVQAQADLTNELAALPLIFAPSVESLTFSGPSIEQAFFESYCFPLAVKEMGSLKHLALKHETLDVPASVINAIGELQTLETLDIQLPGSSQIPPDSLIRIGRKLKMLTDLTLDVHFPGHRVVEQAFSVAQGHDIFPVLKTARVFSRDTHGPCSCIPPSILSRATTLAIVIPAPVRDANHFASYVKAMKASPSIKNLDLLSGGNRGPVIIDDLDAILPFLGPDLALQSLKFGNMYLSRRPDMTDPFLQLCKQRSALSKIPSSLRSLTLPAFSTPGPTRFFQRSSIEIFPVLAICLNLESLSLSVTSTPEQASKSLNSQRNLKQPKRLSKLRYLAIRDCRESATFTAQEYDDIAQLLDLCFPILETMKPYVDSDIEEAYWKEHWWFIERLRKMYQKIRVTQQ